MRRASRSGGFTLLEIVFALAILTTLMAVLFTLSIGLGDTAQIQELQALHDDNARAALLTVVPLLHQAAGSSINWNQLPGQELRFRIAEDLSGNGFAVNAQGDIELGPERLIQRDLKDLNGDGKTDTQLVLVVGDDVTVLANNLTPLPNTDGTTAPGAMVPGFWVEPRGTGVVVRLQFESHTRRNQPVRLDLEELVRPRN